MSWKKRGQAGWTGRKTAKNETKGRERQYGEQEVRQQLQEDFEGDEFRYTYQGKKVKNEQSRLENTIAWYERVLADYKMRDYTSCFGNGWLESGLKKAKTKWQEKFGDKEKKL